MVPLKVRLRCAGAGHVKENEPVICTTALASRVATNCFFTALNWSAGKPTVAVTCNLSSEASQQSLQPPFEFGR